MMPVHQRVIKPHAQTLGAGGVYVFGHQIATARLLGHAVVGVLGIKEAKALVVFGGHDHVLHAGLFGEFGPGAGGADFGLEAAGESFVLGDGNALQFHHPLVPADNAVEAPVHKEAEFGLVPPLHAALTIPICLLELSFCHDTFPC